MMRYILFLLFICLGRSPLYSEINHWEIYGLSSTEYWISQSYFVAHGTYAAEIRPNGPSTSSNQTQYKYLYQTFNIHKDYQYYLDGYIGFKSNRYKSAMLKIRWYPEYDGGGSYIQDDNSQVITNISETYQYCYITNVSPPTNALSCKVELYFQYYKWPAFESIYFDQIQFFCSTNINNNLLSNGDFEMVTQTSEETNTWQEEKNQKISQFDLDKKIFSPSDNEVLKIYFKLPEKNFDIIIRVCDRQGYALRELFKYKDLSEPYPEQEGLIYWDGKDGNNKLVCAGIYFIYFEGTNNQTGQILRLKKVIAVARSLK